MRTLRCINYQSYTSKCEKCGNLCPTNAISLSNTPQIDFKKCVECGLCTSVCPVDAFEIRDFDLDSILLHIKEISKNNNDLYFSCKKVKVPPFKDVMILPCLSMLNKSILLYASVFVKNKIVIDLSSCHSCEIGELCEYIKSEVIISDSILSDFNINNKFEIYTEKKDLPIENKLLNKRDFLDVFASNINNKGSQLIKNTFSKKDDNVYTVETPPYSHKVFIYSIKKLEEKTNTELITSRYFFPDIQINEDCNGCLSCKEVCPTKAIAEIRNLNDMIISFNTWLCVYCGECKKSCSKDAISFKNNNDFSSIRDKKENELIKLELNVCNICNTKFYSNINSSCCEECELIEEN